MAKRAPAKEDRQGVTLVIAVVTLFIVARYGLAAGGLAGAAAYLVHSYRNPITTCWRCKGDPRKRSWTGLSWRESCRWCGTTGKRRRWGSRLLRGGLGKL